MDGSAFRNFPFGALFWWAVFGIGCAALVGLTGIVALVWFVVTHVRIV